MTTSSLKTACSTPTGMIAVRTFCMNTPTSITASSTTAYINNEFDATIVEVAFHDSTPDTQLMREAYVRDAVARATYQGLIKYFRAVDGNTTPATELPPPVTSVRAVSNAAGSVTISWTPPVANCLFGRRGDRLSHLRIDRTATASTAERSSPAEPRRLRHSPATTRRCPTISKSWP